MTITIADGRGALWQWDTGRRVKITDGDGVKQIHYQNRCFGRSVDVDVGDDGTAIIPDELLQDWHPLMAYAYVTDDAGGYTKVQVDFAVHKRARPADYVYTPTERAGFDRLRTEIGDLSALQTDAKDNLVSAINEAAASGGADWAQNDPASKDYVKNRPGGYDIVTPEKIISEWGMYGSNYVSIELSEPLVKGRSYRLTFSENADYSNPVFDSEVVASIDDSNKGSIYVTVKGYASVVQPSTYPEDSATYSCNNDVRNGYCRLVALAHTETVKIPDKYIPHSFFEIKASTNGDPDEEGIFNITADKSAEDILDALKRGEVPYVTLDDNLLLFLNDYDRRAMVFSTALYQDESFVSMVAVRIDGKNSIGMITDLPAKALLGDLSALKTTAKDNLVAAINEVVESGGSSGAVLYTEQLLSVEQENTARDNIKAFPRYQDLKHTNNAFIDIDGLTDSVGNKIARGLVLGIQSSSMGKFQCKCIATDGKTYDVLINLANPSGPPVFIRSFSGILDNDGNFPQQTMASAPTADMQIATKKYVDDHAGGGGGETWELIKAITIADDAVESNALTIDTDESGNSFSLKKVKIFGVFPAYKGESTKPNFSFFMLNGAVTGENAPYCYTSGWEAVADNIAKSCSIEVDLTMSGLQTETVWRSNKVSGEYFGPAKIESITSIGGRGMLIYPGCKFWLYGVRS